MRPMLMAGCALAAVMAAGAASAQDGWYGALDLGYHWKEDIGVWSQNNAPDGGPYNFNISTEDTWAGFARLGYRFDPNWRIELEGGYRPGDIDAMRGFPRTLPASVALCTPGVIRTASTPCGAPEGTIEQWSLMGNLIYDLGDESWMLRPFIGVGAGMNRVSADVLGQFSTSPAGPTPANLSIDDDDMAFAWQVLGGFTYALTDRLSMDFTARYMKTSEVSFESTSTSAAAAWTPGDFTGDFDDTTVSIGLRWAFGAAEAPPPPPPPPARPVAREFIVYFPFDQYVLTADASRVVTEAANYARNGRATRVVVVGHADTSGSAAYNIRLSERRAKTVADALVAAGVNGSTVSVDWKGESAPAVATGDGVKEPLNRRATINIGF